MDVTFPNGTTVRASGIAARDTDEGWRQFGLYCDAAWQPDWPAVTIDWPDFGVPSDPNAAATQIRDAFQRALVGERVEVGCLGGQGRTGTVLACIAVLAGVPGDEAVGWVRRNYRPEAVETQGQVEWVAWFAGWAEQNGSLTDVNRAE